MEITIMAPRQMDAKAIRCELPVWREDDARELRERGFPAVHMSGTKIVLLLDLDSASVIGWPKGVKFDLHLKVVDEGNYWLIGQGGQEIKVRDGYVPYCLPQEFGDYFIAHIDGDGKIDGWKPDPKEVARAFYPLECGCEY